MGLPLRLQVDFLDLLRGSHRRLNSRHRHVLEILLDEIHLVRVFLAPDDLLASELCRLLGKLSRGVISLLLLMGQVVLLHKLSIELVADSVPLLGLVELVQLLLPLLAQHLLHLRLGRSLSLHHHLLEVRQIFLQLLAEDRLTLVLVVDAFATLHELDRGVHLLVRLRVVRDEVLRAVATQHPQLLTRGDFVANI